MYRINMRKFNEKVKEKFQNVFRYFEQEENYH